MKNETVTNTELVGKKDTPESGYDFSYLKTWSKDKLKKRLGAIMPDIEFLSAMYNAKEKVVKIDLSCIDAKSGIAKEHTIYFNTFYKLSTSGSRVPKEFEEFIHNFCTFLCAEKLRIEMLLSK